MRHFLSLALTVLRALVSYWSYQTTGPKVRANVVQTAIEKKEKVYIILSGYLGGAEEHLR